MSADPQCLLVHAGSMPAAEFVISPTCTACSGGMLILTRSCVMNKLTPIFIAGAFVIAGGLAYAQSQMDE